MSSAQASDPHATVYLLGAGASHPCLPLARGVSQGLMDWGHKLDAYVSGLPDGQKRKQFSEMSDELLNWGTLAASHFSIDTLAKKLFLSEKRGELWRLKAAMSAYFMLQQSASVMDQRYDSFFAAILERPALPPAIPDNIWVLTWNCDRLLEKAYHQYCPDQGLVHANITFCKRVVRLNGLLGRAINKGTGDEYNLDFNEDNGKVFERVLSEYLQLRSTEPIISFAFENRNLMGSDLKRLSESACTLVVIGYSFPFFNRYFDKLVLESMPKMERVFLQVLPEHAKAIEGRMKSLRSLPPIQVVDDREQFYVPYDIA
jgi:hypothetical protein